MLAGAMDPMDAAESGWWTKRRRSSARGGYSKLAASNGKKKSGTLRCWTLGIVALLALVILLFLLVMMVDLEQAIESGKKILKIPKGGCTSCEDLTIRGSDKFVTFDRSTDEKGCARLTIQCGLDAGTEAIIQWFQNDKDMGASFMNEEGQSNVRRTLECNPDGQYELDENGHKGIITAIDCIVAVPHEEL